MQLGDTMSLHHPSLLSNLYSFYGQIRSDFVHYRLHEKIDGGTFSKIQSIGFR